MTMTVANRIKAVASSIEAASQTLRRANLTDAEALTVKYIYPEWNDKGHYKVDEIVLWKDNLWRCKKEHDAQASWEPSVSTSSLWNTVTPDGAVEWQDGQSYSKGAQVMHNGQKWESLVDNNTWEPGGVGTETVWKQVS